VAMGGAVSFPINKRGGGREKGSVRQSNDSACEACQTQYGGEYVRASKHIVLVQKAEQGEERLRAKPVHLLKLLGSAASSVMGRQHGATQAVPIQLLYLCQRKGERRGKE